MGGTIEIATLVVIGKRHCACGSSALDSIGSNQVLRMSHIVERNYPILYLAKRGGAQQLVPAR